MLAQQNITTLNEAGAKTIVASCPHCFNTIANEYPQLGGKVPGVQSQEMHRCVSHLIDPDLGRRRRLRSAGRAPRHNRLAIAAIAAPVASPPNCLCLMTQFPLIRAALVRKVTKLSSQVQAPPGT